MAAVGLAALGACSPSAPERTVDQLLLISIDTLRADHLGYAGYARPTSPNLDRFASEALEFTEAYSQAASTLPSHASMMTSLYPSVHKALIETSMPLADGFVTLAEILQDEGWRTAAFVEGGQLAEIWNLDQGFALYDVTEMSAGDEWLPDDLAGILDKAGAWLEANRDEPFFCFVHSYVVHFPYSPRPPYDTMFTDGKQGTLPTVPTYREIDPINRGDRPAEPEEIEYVKALYDGEIRYMDEHVGAFLDHVQALGNADRLMIIFTSDHGEELGEHGRLAEHGHTLYDELLHVPLLVKIPGYEPRIVEGPVRLIDLVPTVLAALGVTRAHDGFLGENLLESLEGTPGERAVFSELTLPNKECASLRREGHKLMAGGGGRLRFFDLESDPGENHDLFGDDPGAARLWVDELREIRERNREIETELAVPVELDSETEERLRALGYLR